jgi:WD40 repeat protein
MTIDHAGDTAAIGRTGALIAMALADGNAALIECAPAGSPTLDGCREQSLANVRGRAVAISPDETSIAIADNSGTISVYDRAGRRIGEPMAVGGSPRALGWAQGRNWLAVGNADGEITVIDLAATPPRPIAKAALASGPIVTLAWSPAGLDLAFACSGGTVCLWPGAHETPSGVSFPPIRRFEGHTASVTRLAWSPDGRRLASAAGDGTVRTWTLDQNVDAGGTLYTEAAAQITKVATSFDGRQVAGGATDGTIRIWDAGSLALLRTIKTAHNAEVASIAWSRSGTLAAAWDGGGITLVPADANAPVRDIDADIDLDANIEFVDDDNRIALPRHSEKRIALLDAIGSSPPRYLPPIGPIQAPWTLAADVGSKTLFASYTDANGDLYAWDLDTGKAAKMDYALPQPRNANASGSLALSRDGRWLAATGGDAYVRIYDVAQKKAALALAIDGGESRVVAFSPDGSKLAALAGDNRLYIWTLNGDRAERFAVIGTSFARSDVEDGDARRQGATWLAWVGNDSIALATSTSAVTIVGFDPARWRRRIDSLAIAPPAPLN